MEENKNKKVIDSNADSLDNLTEGVENEMSAEEKAEYKKSLLPLVIGAVLVFGAAAIAKVIVALAQNFKA